MKVEEINPVLGQIAWELTKLKNQNLLIGRPLTDEISEKLLAEFAETYLKADHQVKKALAGQPGVPGKQQGHQR